jgi:hypothetical protein
LWHPLKSAEQFEGLRQLYQFIRFHRSLENGKLWVGIPVVDIPTFPNGFHIGPGVNPLDLLDVIPNRVHRRNRYEIPLQQFLVASIENHRRRILPFAVAQTTVDDLNPQICALRLWHFSPSFRLVQK